MNRKNVIDLTIVILLLGSLAILIYMAIVFKSEAGQCYQNPLVYGARKLSETNNAEFVAFGTFVNKINSPRIRIDQYNMTVELQNHPSQTFYFNKTRLGGIIIRNES